MNRPTDPPNHSPIHLSKGGSVSTNHKSSNRIQLSRLDDDLLDFGVNGTFIHHPSNVENYSIGHKSDTNKKKQKKKPSPEYIFRWFKFTLKPPNRIGRGKLRLAI